MAKKKAKTSGGQLAARDLSPESHIANLKSLNSRLVKSVMEQREQINRLRSEQASMAADGEIVDAVERDVFRLVLAGATEKMRKQAESAIAELNNSAEMRQAAVEERDMIKTDLERVVEERDLGRKECEMLEKELRSVMREKDIMQRCREDDKRLVEKLGREMEAMMSQKNLDMENLKADSKENGLRVEALELECRLLNEIRERLECEVGELKVSLEELREEKVGFVAAYAIIKKSFFIKSGHLRKEKIKLENYDMKEREMMLQINELKGNMAEMKAEKDLVEERRAKCEIQISKLKEKLTELQFARKKLEDAHRCCVEKISRKETECAAMRREKNVEVDAAVALKRKLTESVKAKHMADVTLEELQKKLNQLSAENEKKKKRIDSLMVEKSALERQLETSTQGLDDMEEKLKIFEDSSGQIFARLNKTITELIAGQESAQQNLISRETGVKEDKDEEMKLFVDNLEAVNIVMKGKETKIKELNQVLEQLQLSVAYAKNKKGIWKWFFPTTTTIFVAAFLAYAAKAR